jgi:hypothetical protein
MTFLKSRNFLILCCLLSSFNLNALAEQRTELPVMTGFSIPAEIVLQAQDLKNDYGEGGRGLLTSPYQLENPDYEGMITSVNLNATVRYTIENYSNLLQKIFALESVSQKEKNILAKKFEIYKTTIEKLANRFENLTYASGPMDELRVNIDREIAQGQNNMISYGKYFLKGMAVGGPVIVGSLVTLPPAIYSSFFAPILEEKMALDKEIELIVGN